MYGLISESSFTLGFAGKIGGWLSAFSEFRHDRLGGEAMPTMLASAALGGLPPLPPPLMNSKDFELDTLSGLTMVSQCFHSGRSTSLVVNQACEVISTMNVVWPLPGTCATM